MTHSADAAASYDFRSPSRLATGIERRFAEWQRGLCKLFSQQVSQHLPFDVKFSFVAVNPRSTRKVLSSLPPETAAFQFKLGQGAFPCLFTYPQPLLFLLVNGMLGDDSAELPENRELSHIERALSEVVAEELASAMAESFLGDEPIPCHYSEHEPHPERTRMFSRDGTTIVSVFQFELNSEVQSCQFVFPYSVLDLFPLGDGRGSPGSLETRKQLESILKKVPLTLAVQLGSVDLKISDASNLRVGDVIVLDQPAAEPLLATVDGKPHLRVWAGKIGSRRAIQIAEDR